MSPGQPPRCLPPTVLLVRGVTKAAERSICTRCSYRGSQCSHLRSLRGTHDPPYRPGINRTGHAEGSITYHLRSSGNMQWYIFSRVFSSTGFSTALLETTHTKPAFQLTHGTTHPAQLLLVGFFYLHFPVQWDLILPVGLTFLIVLFLEDFILGKTQWRADVGRQEDPRWC